MTLEEAIKHCEEKACGNDACSKEHRQLAEWLKELQTLKANNKSIEERAINYAEKSGIDPNKDYFDFCQQDYIAGATEQKAIDEQVRLKKCDDMTQAEYNHETAFVDWCLENGKGTPTYSDAIEWASKEVINKACEWLKENVEGGVHPQSAYGFADKFRKAMEE